MLAGFFFLGLIMLQMLHTTALFTGVTTIVVVYLYVVGLPPHNSSYFCIKISFFCQQNMFFS
jgi:hypothetical protein